MDSFNYCKFEISEAIVLHFGIRCFIFIVLFVLSTLGVY